MTAVIALAETPTARPSAAGLILSEAPRRSTDPAALAAKTVLSDDVGRLRKMWRHLPQSGCLRQNICPWQRYPSQKGSPPTMPDRRAKHSAIDRPETVRLSAEDLPAFVQMFRVKQFFPIFRAAGRLFCF